MTRLRPRHQRGIAVAACAAVIAAAGGTAVTAATSPTGQLAVAEAAVAPVAATDVDLSSFTYFPLRQPQPTTMTAGFSMYVAAWPFQQTYPGPAYQTGLPSTWARPTLLEEAEDVEVYSTIEGGLGWWNDTRFATETPKFIMGGVSNDFYEWANGPGAGAGSAGVDQRDWDTPQGKYGVAQLSPYVLWAPDGLNLAPGTNGELFGYGYHPLPIIDEQTTSLGQEVPTGDNSWTLFLNTANFAGPVTFFVPNFFTKPAIDDPATRGLGFDAGGTDSGRIAGMETASIPAAQATVDGVTYARVTPMQYPATDETSSVLIHRVTSYDDSALSDRVDRWFDGGTATSGRLRWSGARVSGFDIEADTRAGDEVFMTFVTGEEGADEYFVDFDRLATLDGSDRATFRYVWNTDVVTRSGDSFVLPEYYRLEPADPADEREEPFVWRPITAADVPVESGLASHVFPELGTRNDGEPYTTPDAPGSPWTTPGPSSGPHTAELGDGSTVTYHWYRFVDQPAIRYWGFSDAELATMQSRVEDLHGQWTPNRTYLADPRVGELASLDPAVIVEPPAGMEVGYVPIVTRQEATR